MKLFVYGSLMEPRVMAAVAGRAPTPIPARLPHHGRFEVVGEAYPGMVPERGGEVSGILYRNLSPVEMRRLDIFEGRFYTRRRICVESGAGVWESAYTYLVRPQYRHRLAPQRWDYERFRRQGLERFLSGYTGFRTR